MTDRILPVVVGVDGSREALDAVRAGAHEANRRSAPLELVLAFPWPEGRRVPAPQGLDGRAVLRTMAELALESAAQVAGMLGTEPVSSRIVDGDAPDVLTDATASAQLLCLGTQGTGAVRDVLLGSTAAAVVRSAACPLLVVPRREGSSVEEPRGVVVGLEGRDGDAELLGIAFAEADARGCELLAVHAWRHRTPGPARIAVDPMVPEAAARDREEAYLDDVLDGWPDRFPTVPVRRVVEHAAPAPTLLAAALTAELLVVGHRRRRFLDMLGSAAHAVLHRASCPVLVVPLDRPVPGTLRVPTAVPTTSPAPA